MKPLNATILCGAPFSGKRARVLSRFAELLKKNPGSGSKYPDVLLLLPSGRSVRRARQTLLLEGKLDALFGPAVHTFSSLADLVLEDSAASVRLISGVARELLLERVIRQLSSRGSFQFFRGVENLPGFVTALAELIAELKHGEITPEALEKASRALGSLPRHRDISLLYKAYQDALRKENLYDEEGKYWLVRDLLAERKCPLFDRLRALLVDGFYQFTPTQVDIIEHLARSAEEFLMTLPFESAPGREELFGVPSETLELFRRRFSPRVEEISLEAPGALGHLRKHLFCFDANRARNPVGLRDEIKVFESFAPEGEIQNIGREIKRLIHEENFRPDEIAVVFRSLEGVSDLVEEAFSDMGIPFWISHEMPLSGSPLAQVLLRLLLLRVDDFPRERVLSVLKSNYLSLFNSQLCGVRSEKSPHSAIRPDSESGQSAILERVVLASGIVEGRKGWETKVALLARLDATSGPYDARRAQEEGEIEKVGGQLKREEVETASRILCALFEGLDLFKEHDSLLGHVETLRELLDRFGIFKAASSGPDASVVRDDLTCAKVLEGALQELTLLGRTTLTEHISYEEFVSLLERFISKARYFPETLPFGRLAVMDVYEARHVPCGVVFLAGLNDGLFPLGRRDDPFFAQAERKTLREKGVPMELHLRRLQEEMFLFYLAASRARNRLYLSFAYADSEGEELLPSMYLADVEGIFECAIPRKRFSLGERFALEAPAGERDLLRRFCWTASTKTAREELLLAALHLPLSNLEDKTLARAFQGFLVEKERLTGKAYGRFEGILSSKEVLDDLSMRLGKPPSFSVTDLETFLECPFKFFAESVLDLEDKELPAEELSAAHRGSIYHRILALLFRALLRRGDLETTITSSNLDSALLLLRETSAKIFKEWRAANPAVDASVWKVEERIALRVLEAYLRSEARRNDERSPGEPMRVPSHFEISFGRTKRKESCDPSSVREGLAFSSASSGVVLSGCVDRVDFLVRSGKEREGLVVLDYKTGRSPTAARIRQSRSIQIPIYLLACERLLFKGKVEPVIGATVLLQEAREKILLSRSGGPRGAIVEEEFSKILEDAEKNALRSAGEILSGRFPPHPAWECPANCPNRSLCRIYVWKRERID